MGLNDDIELLCTKQSQLMDGRLRVNLYNLKYRSIKTHLPSWETAPVFLLNMFPSWRYGCSDFPSHSPTLKSAKHCPVKIVVIV